MAGYDWVSLTTDYGLEDGFVAACHGVLARLAPAVGRIDVTHRIPPGDLRRGAAILAQTLPYLPPAVHVAVVDPGVGTDRRAIAIATAGGGLLVGPDNGLLLWAARALGGVTTAVELSNPEWLVGPVSRTFHGRDLFVPAAARLAAGAALSDAGLSLDPEWLVQLPEPVVRVAAGSLEAEVLTVDRFGNLQLAAGAAEYARLAGTGGDTIWVNGTRARLGRTFGDVPAGDLVVLVDSADRLAVAVNGGSAATALGAAPGDVVRLSRAEREG